MTFEIVQKVKNILLIYNTLHYNKTRAFILIFFNKFYYFTVHKFWEWNHITQTVICK